MNRFEIRNRKPSFIAFASSAALAALLSACATQTQAPITTASPSEPASYVGCADLHADIAVATHEMQAARKRQADAWKVVVPFVVVARYANAGADVEAAEQRLASLQISSSAAGCDAVR